MLASTALGTHSSKMSALTLASFPPTFFNKEIIMQKFIKCLAQVVVTSLISAFFVIMFIEWAAGCGESYIDNKGIHHSNECIIIK